jgi:hypothetical protein
MARGSDEFSGKSPRKDTAASLGGPPHLEVGMDGELEALLSQRLDQGGQSIEATPEFWARLKERARRSANGGGPAR